MHVWTEGTAHIHWAFRAHQGTDGRPCCFFRAQDVGLAAPVAFCSRVNPAHHAGDTSLLARVCLHRSMQGWSLGQRAVCVLSPLAGGKLGLPPPTPRPGHPDPHRSARAAWAPKAVLRLASGSREETGAPMAKRQSWCLLWRPLGGKPWPPSQEGDPGKLREDLTELQRPLRTVLEAGEQKHCGACLGPPPRPGQRRDATDRAGTQLAP